MPFKELPHKSDLYLQITGTSLENLFEEAAIAMFSHLGTSTGGKQKYSVDLHAPDPEQLLVKWLENLLVEHEVTRRVFTAFKVEIDGSKLHGTALGGPGDIVQNIKGVTFFNLKIEEKDGKYAAKVLFDI